MAQVDAFAGCVYCGTRTKFGVRRSGIEFQKHFVVGIDLSGPTELLANLVTQGVPKLALGVAKALSRQ